MNPILADLIKNPKDLSLALQSLRQAAAAFSGESLLLQWGRKYLKLEPESEQQWLQRAWWGLHAGELLRAYLFNSSLRDQVLDLITGPDWSELEAARTKHGGVILAGAHIGPPKTAMNFLMNQGLPLMIWTDMNHFPEWVKTTFDITFVDPARNPALLAKTALHLRSGGVLFGAPDAPSGRRTISFESIAPWNFSLGIPTLARVLNLPVFRFLALWNDNRIKIECERAASPQNDLDEEHWNHQWVENFCDPLDRIVQTSPENLRFLLFVDNRAISRELQLFTHGGLL